MKDSNYLDLLRAILRFSPYDLQRQIETLSEREQKVLSMRFGLDDGILHTLAEVSKEITPITDTTNAQNVGGITKERVRQIEAKAIRRLMHPTRMKRMLPHYIVNWIIEDSI